MRCCTRDTLDWCFWDPLSVKTFSKYNDVWFVELYLLLAYSYLFAAHARNLTLGGKLISLRCFLLRVSAEQHSAVLV